MVLIGLTCKNIPEDWFPLTRIFRILAYFYIVKPFVNKDVYFIERLSRFENFSPLVLLDPSSLPKRIDIFLSTDCLSKIERKEGN